jgi:hypothetical protein
MKIEQVKLTTRQVAERLGLGTDVDKSTASRALTRKAVILVDPDRRTP